MVANVHELIYLDQLIWGKMWDGVKEGPYSVIGGTRGVPPEQLKASYPGEVLIGRPYTDKTINSFAFSKLSSEMYLWSHYFFDVGKQWDEWTNNDNRPFIIEHHLPINKRDFLKLRFNITSFVDGEKFPALNVLYHKFQDLEKAILEMPSNDEIKRNINIALVMLASKDKFSRLLTTILDGINNDKHVVIIGSKLDINVKLEVIQSIFLLLPTSKLLDFSFTTNAYLMSKLENFSLSFLEPGVPYPSDTKFTLVRELEYKYDSVESNLQRVLRIASESMENDEIINIFFESVITGENGLQDFVNELEARLNEKKIFSEKVNAEELIQYISNTSGNIQKFELFVEKAFIESKTNDILKQKIKVFIKRGGLARIKLDISLLISYLISLDVSEVAEIIDRIPDLHNVDTEKLKKILLENCSNAQANSRIIYLIDFLYAQNAADYHNLNYIIRELLIQTKQIEYFKKLIRISKNLREDFKSITLINAVEPIQVITSNLLSNSPPSLQLLEKLDLNDTELILTIIDWALQYKANEFLSSEFVKYFYEKLENNAWGAFIGSLSKVTEPFFFSGLGFIVCIQSHQDNFDILKSFFSKLVKLDTWSDKTRKNLISDTFKSCANLNPASSFVTEIYQIVQNLGEVDSRFLASTLWGYELNAAQMNEYQTWANLDDIKKANSLDKVMSRLQSIEKRVWNDGLSNAIIDRVLQLTIFDLLKNQDKATKIISELINKSQDDSDSLFKIVVNQIDSWFNKYRKNPVSFYQALYNQLSLGQRDSFIQQLSPEIGIQVDLERFVSILNKNTSSNFWNFLNAIYTLSKKLKPFQVALLIQNRLPQNEKMIIDNFDTNKFESGYLLDLRLALAALGYKELALGLLKKSFHSKPYDHDNQEEVIRLTLVDIADEINSMSLLYYGPDKNLSKNLKNISNSLEKILRKKT